MPSASIIPVLLVVAEGPPGQRFDTHAVMVRVDDVDGHHRRAVAGGASVLAAPETHPFGERQYTAVDPGGHVWTFSQTVADVDPRDWAGVPS